MHNTRVRGKNLTLYTTQSDNWDRKEVFYFNGSKLFNDIPNETKDLNSVNSIDHKLFYYC